MLRSWDFLDHGEERINPILRHPEQGPVNSEQLTVNSSLRVDKQSQMCDSTDKNCSRFTGYCSLKRKVAFTLAEVLITLGIIGVVAAMTLPTLIQGYQKSVAANRLKQAYAQITVAMDKASAEYDGGPMENWCSGDETIDGVTFSKFHQGCFHRAMKEIAVKLYPPPDDVRHAACYEGTEYRPYTAMDGSTDRFTANHMHFSTESWSAKLPSGACVIWNGVYTHDASGKVWIDIDGPYAGFNRMGKDLFYFSYAYGRDNVAHGNGQNGRSLTVGYQGYNRSDLARWCDNGVGDSCTPLVVYDGWQIKKDYPWK